MQQTFYIDQDEEISSIIERLKKSISVDNYLIVPKRALFLQSLVNFKLVKLEADKMKKSVVIVTQDTLGRGLAEKAGLAVRSSMEEHRDESDGTQPSGLYGEYGDDIDADKGFRQQGVQFSHARRLADIGSHDYYAKESSLGKESIDVPQDGREHQEVFLGRHQSELKPNTVKNRMRRNEYRENKGNTRINSASLDDAWVKQGQRSHPSRVAADGRGMLDAHKERAIEKIFNHTGAQVKQQKDLPIKTGKKTRKIMYAFIIFCGVLFSMVAVYVFIPAAKVNVFLRTIHKKEDVKMIALVSGESQDAQNIRLRFLQKEDSITLGYNATGKGKSAAQTKAMGIVTIYNTYSDAPQKLLATTRLEDPQGHIFRITKTVTVPGISGNGEQGVPGSVQVQVIADQPGEDFNIPPSTFTIPGFKDSPKYDKFYAKSASSMAGGKSDGSAAAIVAQQDIETAKEKTEQTLHNKMEGALNGELYEGELLLPELTRFSVTQSISAQKVGANVQNFEYTAKGVITALVFVQTDVKRLVSEEIMKGYEKNSLDGVDIGITYGQINPDFEGKRVTFSANGELNGAYAFDADAFKKAILGKNIEQVTELARKFTGVQNIEIELFPTFMASIPQFSNNVTVTVSR